MTDVNFADSFIGRHQLWTEQQIGKADEIVALVKDKGIRQIRIGWGDQHGIVRSKTVLVPEFLSSLRNGKDFQLVTTLFDTANFPVVAPFSNDGLGVAEMVGLPDGILVPDPNTFKLLPWAANTGWILSDAYFRSGNPVPFSTRQILRDQLAVLHNEGYDLIAGLEIEFYITRLQDPMLEPEQCGQPPDPPKVKVLNHGFQYLTDNRNDEVADILQVLVDNVLELGLPLATFEDEWGPGQCEFTFAPLPALEAADTVLLFRSAVKQLCRRQGYHATFMARPGIANFFPSGWHLHQSLALVGDRSNAFASNGQDILSSTGLHYIGGMLKHAAAASLLTTPTVNGYKRFRPNSFAPDNACWGIENRGAMLRIIATPGDPNSRIENRIGEPTANPYLYLASQVISGLDGMRHQIDPGPPVKEAYLSDQPKLPNNLLSAIAAFRESELFRQELGEVFVNYLVRLKENELGRFLSTVTDWEHREYFEMY